MLSRILIAGLLVLGSAEAWANAADPAVRKQIALDKHEFAARLPRLPQEFKPSSAGVGETNKWRYGQNALLRGK